MVMRTGELIRPEAERRKVQRGKLYEAAEQARERLSSAERSFQDGLREYQQRALEGFGTTEGKLLADDKLEKLKKAREIAMNQAEAAGYRLEAFDHERDVTGARKGDFYGRDLNAIFDGLHDGFGGIDKSAERIHVMQVNMGGLERLNKIGGHKLGDKGLEHTCDTLYDTLEATIRESLGTDESLRAQARSHFEIYRTGSNDFSIVLKDLDASTAAKIEGAIGSSIGMDDLPNGETLPLAVNTLSLKEIRDMWKGAKVDFSEKDEPRLFVDLVKEQVQMGNDIQKNELRLQRLVLMQEANPEEAKAFYEEYLKKSLGRLFLVNQNADPLDYESFLAQFGQRPSETLDRAIDVALYDYRERNKNRLELVENVSKHVLRRETKKRLLSLDENAEMRKISFPPSVPGGLKIESLDEFLGQTEGAEKPLRYPPTEGEKVLSGLRNEVARLNAMLEGGLEDDDRPLVSARLEKAQERLRAEEVKRDRATGLYERGVFFANCEKAIAEGEPMTVIAIDMAFLKYFDREGGRDTGNGAIKAAARIMDKVLLKYRDMGAEAYRMGGDEFSIALSTKDPETVRKIKEEIAGLAQEAVIPALDTAHTAKFEPENIRFNIGSCTVDDQQSFRQQMLQAGFAFKYPADSPEGVKELTDIAVRIADRESELEKTIDRYMLLIEREMLVPPKSEANRDLRGNLDILEDYSQKAIGADRKSADPEELTGMDFINARVMDLRDGMSPQEISEKFRSGAMDLELRRLRKEITEHVIKIGWAEVQAKVANKEYVDQLMEMTTRKIYLSRKIDHLQNQLNETKAVLRTQMDKNKELESRLRTLDEEKQSLVQARNRLSMAA